MRKFHIKKGDEVVLIAGAGRPFRDPKTGQLEVKRGKVIEVLRSKERAIVEGMKMIKRHTRKNQQNPQGAIVEREGTIHISNLMPAAKFDARVAKRGGTVEPAKA